MRKINLILIVLLIIGLMIVSGCSEITKVTDPCKSAFEDCNYGCGDGLLNKVCKEKCSYDYRKCQEGKQ